MSLPPFNTSRGVALLTAAPPFDFDGVTARVFPLRADPVNLQSLCDNYLNTVPPEVAVFKPGLPVVFLIILNYGRMSQQASNSGWVSQDEVGFCVPVQQYRMVDGKMRYVDWSVFFPFIFVNQPSSLIEGRQVYGWRKQLAWFEPGLSPWLVNPTASNWLMSLSTQTYPFFYDHRSPAPQLLLEIDRRGRPPLSERIFSVGHRFNPVRRLSEILTDSGHIAAELMNALQHGMASEGLAELRRLAPHPAALVRRLLEGKIYTLRQFRDAEQTDLVAYQALVESVMRVKQIQRGGLLSLSETFLGDPTGGYRVHLHRWTAEPIVETLGLAVSEWNELPNTAEDRRMVTTGPAQNTTLAALHESRNKPGEGRGVAILDPILPFWVEMDMFYSGGHPLCWRDHDCDWQTELSVAEHHPPKQGSKNTYNNSLGGLGYQVPGPYHFPEVSLRVLPLPADKDALEALCHGYLDDGQFDSFHVREGYVYLLIWEFAGVTSAGSADIEAWAQRQIEFAVPVVNKDDPVDGEVLLSAYAFGDSIRAVTSFGEGYGWPMAHADLISPPDVWLASNGPLNDRCVLQMRAQTLTSFDSDAEFEQRIVMEVLRGADAQAPNANQPPPEWGERLRTSTQKRWQENAEEPLDPMHFVALKQFRAAEAPTKAAYQAVVRTPMIIDDVQRVHRLDGRIEVRLHDYINVPIATNLGLSGAHVEYRKSTRPGRIWQGVPVRRFNAVDPFWMTVRMHTEPSKRLRWRVRSKTWQTPPPAKPPKP